MKICKECGKEKDDNKKICKSCHSKRWYNKNKISILDRNKKYREKNKEKAKEYYQKNKDYFRKKGEERRMIKKEEISTFFKTYYIQHKDYFKEHRKKYHKSKKGKETKLKWCNEYNSKNKHVVLWRSLLRRTIVQLQQEKSGSTYEMLGYTALELKKHIESNWCSGMTWDNYGDWHLDHIRSVATFSVDDSPSIVNALSNLMPMWSTNRIIDGIFYEGNLNKGKKLN